MKTTMKIIGSLLLKNKIIYNFNKKWKEIARELKNLTKNFQELQKNKNIIDTFLFNSFIKSSSTFLDALFDTDIW